MTTRYSGAFISFESVLHFGETRASDLFVDAPREVARGIVSLQFHEVIARRDLDEEREVAARRDRQSDVRLRNAEEVVGLARDAEAVVLRAFDPLLELDHEI